ncbi:hypothetical protein FVR03_01095 [Pontibacter qinzhouensis]|uniref:Antirepressor protein C-terminal domain-containing protein n=1 Tax=Pontibacter qinzhouensis TaxID=2603253 RepID=A0A5C8KB71_9BACT|nr:phage antirepressor KilAC domain-containing protein [Pontibacter qinzhouensis]TXK52339.1 hypothetical protein FVR03_01095 [Pontibacter qinzhouensis]
MSLLQIQTINDVQVIESTIMANELGIKHKNLLETITKYQPEIEEAFGAIAFQTRPLPNGGKPLTLAYLTEDQSIFISTLSRNSERVVQFKTSLVQSFQAAKRLVHSVTATLTDDEFLAKALIMSAEKLQKLEQKTFLLEADNEKLLQQTTEQEQLIKSQAPKAAFYDKVLDAKNSMPITLIAKELGISAQSLNAKLKEKGVQYKVGGVWVLTQKYSGLGYTEMRTVNIPSESDPNRTTLQMCWTQKGRELIHNKINSLFNIPSTVQLSHLKVERE